MKILVLGGCGFVGSNICIYLQNKNFNVSSVDNLSRETSKINLERLKKNGIINYCFDLSINNKLLQLKKFDLLIDCCAEPSVEVSKSNIELVFNSNLKSTLNILEKCKLDNSKIIFLSSSRVYSIKEISSRVKNINKKFNKFLISESFSTDSPISIYGYTKLCSEKLIREYAYAFNIKYLINRFGVISGPWQFGKQDQGFFSLWIWRHLKRQKLEYIGYECKGNQIRDILHISDVCDLIYEQIINLKKTYNHTFNAGGGLKNSLSLKELTKMCQKLTNNKIQIQKNNIKTSIYDIPYYISDNKKIYSKYKWRVKRNIKNILDDTYRVLINNKKTFDKIK